MGTRQGATCSGLSFLSTSWNPCLIYPHLRALLVLGCEAQGSVCSLEMLREGKNLSSPLWLTLIHSFIHSAHVSGGRQPCSHIWLPQSHVAAEIRATKEKGSPQNRWICPSREVGEGFPAEQEVNLEAEEKQ